MKFVILVSGLLLASQAAFAQNLTGDTVGASLTSLSSLNGELEMIINPETAIGTIGFFDGQKQDRALCYLLGKAEAHSFAVQSELRFYTEKQMNAEVKNGNNDIIALRIENLINVLNNASNENCLGSKIDTGKIKQTAIQAKVMANTLSNTIEKELANR